MNRTALITGASSGIGLELAKLFAADGYGLVLVARRADALDRLGSELAQEHGIRWTTIPVDLARPGAAGSVADAVAQAGLIVDALVNNAGYATYGPFAEIPLADELAMLQLNVLALTALTKLLLPSMLARGTGRILNVASEAAFVPGPLMAAYYASKAYVLSFTEALAEELTGTGVTATVLCPGPTATGFEARAGMAGARLMTLKPLMLDAARVARTGYTGMQHGARVVVPGLANRLMVQSIRVSPRRAVTKLSRWMIGRRS